MRIQGNGLAITSTEEWFAAAPPKGKLRQWQPYRSALELARAWCAGSGIVRAPREVIELLESHPLSAGADLEAAEGWAELHVRFDSLAGEPRNTDLAMVATVSGLEGAAPARRIAVSIEAKADESFGPRITGAVRAAEARRAAGKASHGDVRARSLMAAILGARGGQGPATLALRYQLLTATAGALAFAEQAQADVAVLVFHEFVDSRNVRTSPARVAANARDLDAFLSWMTDGTISSLAVGRLVGPIPVPRWGAHPNRHPSSYRQGPARSTLVGLRRAERTCIAPSIGTPRPKGSARSQ